MVIINGVYTVYVHINKTNGKMYVGITSQNPEERWKNGTGYDTSPRFYNAIKKYGWNNFEHEIFAENLTENEAKNMEKLLIKQLDLQNDDFGYNIKEGGEGGRIPEETRIKISNANKGKIKSNETRKKYSDAHKGKKLSREHAEAISNANKGRPRTEKEMIAAKRTGLMKRGKNHPLYGTKLTEEQKDKMMKGNILFRANHPECWDSIKKKVLLVETGRIYNSIQEASNDLKICRSQISEAASGSNGHKTAGGYHWKFVKSLETSRKT